MARTLRCLLALVALLVLSSRPARADEPIRRDIRLIAADLVDEAVYSWLQNSPVAGPTSLVVAEIEAPIGIDHRFDEDIENHLFEVLRANPALKLQLVHCSVCRNWVAVSNPKRTIIGNALGQPEGISLLRELPHLHALSLHFDVVGDELILWAEIYEIKPPQRVIWARRYSESSTARVVLREPNRLISISEAREEQRKVLFGRDSVQTVTRFPIRTFDSEINAVGATAPLIFLEQSVEGSIAPKNERRAGLSLGLTSIRNSMQGWSFGAHYMQLLGRKVPSLTNPDLYLKAGFHYIRLEGPGAAAFGERQIDVSRLLNSSEDPKASLTTWQLGLEARIKYRFGIGAFVEYIPALDESTLIATHRVIIPFHSIGVSGVFQW
jgi:hypothetical protein